MRNEVLRMERVTYKEDEVVKLKDFNLQIFQGEVMGFLPVNSHGKTALLKLLERNLPLYDGYIYYGGEKVNTWKEHYKATNRISIIQEKSSLAGNLNIADNASGNPWILPGKVEAGASRDFAYRRCKA